MVRERTAYVGELFVGEGGELLREGTAEKGGKQQEVDFFMHTFGGKGGGKYMVIRSAPLTISPCLTGHSWPGVYSLRCHHQ